jgi:hypothetical protein
VPDLRRLGQRSRVAYSRRAVAEGLRAYGPTPTFITRRRESSASSSAPRNPQRSSRCPPRSAVTIARRATYADDDMAFGGLTSMGRARWLRWGPGRRRIATPCGGVQTSSSMRMARWSIALASSPSSLIASSIPVASASSLLLNRVVSSQLGVLQQCDQQEGGGGERGSGCLLVGSAGTKHVASEPGEHRREAE